VVYFQYFFITNINQQHNYRPNHKVECKNIAKREKILKEVEAKLEARSGVDAALDKLAALKLKDNLTEAKEVVDLIATSDTNAILKVKLLDRMADDQKLVAAIHSDENTATKLYDALVVITESDARTVMDIAKSRVGGGGTTLTLLTLNAVFGLLRTHRGEIDYVAPSMHGAPNSDAAYSADRSARYFKKSWQPFLALAGALWFATTKGHGEMLGHCKSLFRLLPLCLLHKSVAQAVLSASNGPWTKDSPSLRPLIGMLDLKDRADNVEGLTNQVAALLVVQARANPDSIDVNALALERAITSKFDRHQKAQWKSMSLTVAQEMVDKGRQLKDHEFRRVMQRIGLA
jgi:hypothetical protein